MQVLKCCEKVEQFTVCQFSLADKIGNMQPSTATYTIYPASDVYICIVGLANLLFIYFSCSALK